MRQFCTIELRTSQYGGFRGASCGGAGIRRSAFLSVKCPRDFVVILVRGTPVGIFVYENRVFFSPHCYFKNGIVVTTITY